MKTIYIVTSCGFRPPVAFESKERAEAVRAMCGGSIGEVPVLDAATSMVDFLKDMNRGLEEHKTCGACEEGESDVV